MLKIETERLVIRRFSLNDDIDLFSYASNSEVGPEAGWQPHANIEESQSLLNSWITNPEIFAIEEKASGHVIGSIGLHQHFQRAVPSRELGYALKRECWGKGYMSEAVKVMIDYAFEQFGIALLVVKHHHQNDRSRRVIEKAVFHFEGVERMGKIHPSTKEVLDIYIYSMTKQEWRDLRC